ncbi:M16 family metallopeptidase [Gluconobacter sphaericus]|uniref:Peptidase M16 n=1 Tax=Gluconobacter sphaericus NBRC 12467 TaxID=1307951 RepID=A0AA37SG46_9PROT|nr:pitrilysin family protein [Gluconobacter sphaericus]MBF0884431.1 insulinase family protein [Gluconobacter sphaericus]GBR53187.1 processing protease M16 family [Gluconobacter sphaericus NBRC 12467]GEB41557.1 peptidase M16 [Gluconobacter sphaericus NBRC 12467]GLQ83668.1 peptidase M16 [Gluconobacter sphaericus NBRC 12467]
MPDTIEVTRLDNGLTIITEQMDRVETVSFGAYVSIGTRDETAANNGVSHFLEHMAFKGTERRSAAQIAEDIENVGGYINAYTARETTAYYVKLLKNDLALGVDIIGDILTHSTFLDAEIERERGVILQEIGQANDTPDDIIFDQFQERAFPEQPMGRPTLGTEDLVSTMTRDTLMSYMREHYTTHNVTIAAAGNLHHQQVVDLVKEHFRDLPTHQTPRPRAAAYEGGELRTTRELDQAHLVMGFPSVSYMHPDHYAVMILSTLLGGGMSSRLFQEIRERRGLVYSVYSFASPFSDSGLFGLYAGTGEEQAAELVPVMIDELKRLQDGLSEAELSRARAQLKSSLLMSLESTGSRCEQLARQIQVHNRPVPTSETVAKIDAVTEADILRVARTIFSGTPTFTAIGPVGNMPSLEDITARLAA